MERARLRRLCGTRQDHGRLPRPRRSGRHARNGPHRDRLVDALDRAWPRHCHGSGACGDRFHLCAERTRGARRLREARQHGLAAGCGQARFPIDRPAFPLCHDAQLLPARTPGRRNSLGVPRVISEAPAIRVAAPCGTPWRSMAATAARARKRIAELSPPHLADPDCERERRELIALADAIVAKVPKAWPRFQKWLAAIHGLTDEACKTFSPEAALASLAAELRRLWLQLAHESSDPHTRSPQRAVTTTTPSGAEIDYGYERDIQPRLLERGCFAYAPAPDGC